MRTISIRLPIFVILLQSVFATFTGTQPSVFTSAQGPANRTDAQLKTIRDQVQVKLNQFRMAKGFPGGTIGFVLPDGRSGAVSTGVSDLATKRALTPNDLLLAG